jgi:lipid II:glycine glycyltransferase (peptidoglycan interpeptide bridge formation enzyme)
MKDVNATVIVDLNPSEDDIFNSLQKDARWGIKKAQREGLVVEASTDWKSFYHIYLETMESVGVKAETLNHLKENADILFLCKKNEKIIGGASLHVINNIPKLTRNASLKECLTYQPNNLLYWHCVLWSKENGYDKLDLGGWQINPRGQARGVNKFKERWGKVVYLEQDYPFHKAIGRKLIRKSNLLQKISNKIKKRD